MVKVGEVIAILETASKSESSGEETKTEEPVVMDEPLIAEGAVETTGSNTMEIPRTSSSRFYSPLVRSIAAKEGITLEELEKNTRNRKGWESNQARYSQLPAQEESFTDNLTHQWTISEIRTNQTSICAGNSAPSAISCHTGS